MWKATGPVYGQDCQNGTGKVLKDNKCWMKADAGSTNWNSASGLCTGVWHLPSQQEFDALLLAYYPNATASSPGHYYSGSTSAFAADWGAASGSWWSSTTDPSYSPSAYLLYIPSSVIYSNVNLSKTGSYQVRCVSS